MKILSIGMALLVLFAVPVRADVVRVAVASNFTPVLETLAPHFEKHSGHTLGIISGATGNHYAQILNGAPFDVFLAADDERPLLLEQAGRAVAGTRFTYALGKLVLWSVDAQRVDSDGAVLRQGMFARLALANPKLAPYGVAAQELLVALGLWDGLQRKIVLGDNIAQTLQFVQTGNAQLGFIALSQLADVSGTGSHWLVPEELYSPIVQQGVLLKDSAPARAFIDFMKSDAGRELIRAAGYAWP
jgi:molybdate transport system substrate-binding protein